MTDSGWLDAIEARLRAATPGPWHREHGEYGCVMLGDYGWVAPGAGPEYDVDSEQGKADAEFIAHAPEDIAALVTAVRERDASLARVEALVHPLAGFNTFSPSGPIFDVSVLRDRIRAALAGEGE